MKNYLIFIALLIGINFCYAQPISSDNMELWLRADSVLLENGKVKQWYDLSGNNYQIIQNDANSMPTQATSSLNNQAIIKFNGQSNYLNGEDILDYETKNHSIFLIAKINSGSCFSKSKYGAANNRYALINIENKIQYLYVDNSDKSSNLILVQNDEFYFFQVINNRKNSHNIFFLNNISQDTANIDPDYNINSDFNFLIGAYNNRTGGIPPVSNLYLDGEIAEIIIFDTLLTELQTQKVYHYLQEKYTPAVNLGYDINVPYGFCDTTIATAQKSWFKSYMWNTGETTPTISVDKMGTYSVTVTDIFGFTSTDSVKVSFTSPSLENSNICLGDSVLYEPNLDDYQYLWSDGSTNPSLWIKEQGNYSLVLTDSNSCSSTFNFTVKVDSFADHIGFKYDTISLCAGNTINLDYGQDKCSSFLWSPSNNTTPKVQVDTSGWKTLFVQNPIGCQAKDSVFVNITGKAPDINYSVDNLCFGESTNFTDLSTSNENIIETKWFFSSTDSLIGTSVAKTFDTVGTQNIILKVVAESGCYNTEGFEVEILDVANISFDNAPICVGIESNFSPNLSIPQGSSIVNFNWKVNNFSVANTQNLDYTFSSSGIYQVELSVELDNGCASSFSKEVIVESTYEFSDNLSLVNPNDASIFENNQNINFSWNPDPLAVDYLIQISDMDDFSNILLENHSTENSMNLFINQDYDTLFWRVKAYNPCLVEQISNTHKLIRFGLKSLNNKTLWLRADSVLLENGKVKQWYDLSGNNYQIIQNDANSMPTQATSSLNNQAIIKFNGQSNYLNGEDILDYETKNHSIFLIAKINSGSCFSKSKYGSANNRYALINIENKIQYLYVDNSDKSSNLIPVQNDEFYFFQVINNRKNSHNIFFLNNISQDTANIDPDYNINSDFNFLIGAYNNRTGGIPPASNLYLDGEIAEIIIFDTLLTELQTQKIHHYLQEKYTPSVNLGYDINIPYGFCDTTITIASKPWFTNYQWSTSKNDTLSTLTITESGTYAVTVTDIFGFKSIDSLRVCYPKFNLLTDTSICLGDTLLWTLNPKGSYTYDWSTGSSNSYIRIGTSGTYSVTITDTNGYSWSPKPIQILIDSFPVSASLGNDTTLCRGNRLELETGQAEASSFLWHDGSTLPYYQIQQMEEVSVKVKNALGCVAQDTILINVAGTAPVVDFTYDRLCRNIPIQFTNISQAPDGAQITETYWTLDNKPISSEINTIHTFSEVGSNIVTLTAITNKGCYNDTSHQITIHELPKAKFTPQQVCKNASVTLQNHSESTDGEILSYNWQIEEEFYNQPEPSHKFTIVGNTFVQMVVCSEYNCPDTLQTIIKVRPAPIAMFNYDTICKGNTIGFNNLSTTNLNQQYSSLWRFSDSITSIKQHPTFTFTQTGTEVVELIVRQIADGCTDTLKKLVQVHALPAAIIDNQTSCANTPNILKQTSTFGFEEKPGTYLWHLNDTILTGSSPQFINSQPGSYPVTLTVTNAAGCSHHAEALFTIFPAPLVQYAAIPDTLFVPSSLTLENTSDYLQYTWKINNSFYNSDTSPTLIIDSTGSYIIQLIGIDNNGCINTHTDTTQAVIPISDIGISKCRAIINEGRLYVSVELYNDGTKIITNPELNLILSNGQEFVEIYAGSIYPSRSTTYGFRSQYILQNNISLDWLITKVTYDHDQITENNSCTYVFGDMVRIFPPYPNPASSTINLDFIALENDIATLKLYNLMGELVIKNTFKVNKGLNRTTFPTPSRTSGIHTLEIKIGKQKRLFKMLLE